MFGPESIEEAEEAVSWRENGIILVLSQGDMDIEVDEEDPADGDPFTISKALPDDPVLTDTHLSWGILAIDDDRVIGAATITEDAHGDGSRTMFLDAIYVNPSRRGEGIGAMIADAVVRVFEKRLEGVPDHARDGCLVDAEPLSPGGHAVVNRIREATSERRECVFDMAM